MTWDLRCKAWEAINVNSRVFVSYFESFDQYFSGTGTVMFYNDRESISYFFVSNAFSIRKAPILLLNKCD